jgi:hypothetical protein
MFVEFFEIIDYMKSKADQIYSNLIIHDMMSIHYQEI